MSKNLRGEKGFRVQQNEIIFIDARKKGSMVSRSQKKAKSVNINVLKALNHFGFCLFYFVKFF
ncbi:hypothetical protein CHI06_16650 [Bacillus sp. 7884-1]|nr:hypothetical protein CHI06_16650 [Bacillus sp. 7884-1]